MCPKLDAYKPLIDQWLLDDRKAPRKQRHTAKRVFKRLLAESEGFDCSYRLVAQYVAYRKANTRSSVKSLICRSSTTPARLKLISALHSSLKTVYPMRESIWYFLFRSAMPGISS